MTQYLLSVYQPDGPIPPPESLKQISRDLDSALEWGRRLAHATTLPIEMRPFQDRPES